MNLRGSSLECEKLGILLVKAKHYKLWREKNVLAGQWRVGSAKGRRPILQYLLIVGAVRPDQDNTGH